MERFTHNKCERKTARELEGDYHAQGLRILARIIARAYLRNSQLKGDKRRERKTY